MLIGDNFRSHKIVPILASLCYLVENLVSYCGKHNPLNAYTTCSVINLFSHKIIIFYFIGPDVSGVLNCVEQLIYFTSNVKYQSLIGVSHCLTPCEGSRDLEKTWKLVFIFQAWKVMEFGKKKGRSHVKVMEFVNTR